MKDFPEYSARQSEMFTRLIRSSTLRSRVRRFRKISGGNYEILQNDLGKLLIYAMGGLYNDLTGLMTVDAKGKSYQIERLPKNSKVYDPHIKRLLRKVQPDYDKGVFKERIAYEI